MALVRPSFTLGPLSLHARNSASQMLFSFCAEWSLLSRIGAKESLSQTARVLWRREERGTTTQLVSAPAPPTLPLVLRRSKRCQGAVKTSKPLIKCHSLAAREL